MTRIEAVHFLLQQIWHEQIEGAIEAKAAIEMVLGSRSSVDFLSSDLPIDWPEDQSELLPFTAIACQFPNSSGLVTAPHFLGAILCKEPELLRQALGCEKADIIALEEVVKLLVEKWNELKLNL